MNSVVIVGGRRVGGGEKDIRGISGNGGKIKQKSKKMCKGAEYSTKLQVLVYC